MVQNRDSLQYGWFMAKIYSLMMLFNRDTFVIDFFKNNIETSKDVLELGSGTGKDYRILAQNYNITGSDYSDSFLKPLKRRYGESSFLKIDALTMETGKTFDVIYSNKVLQHLLPGQLELSLLAQYKALNPGGILFHCVWKGISENGKTDGLPDVQFSLEDFEKGKGAFSIENYVEYKEFSEDDSFIIIMRKKS